MTEQKPCGCIISTRPDGRKVYAPCVACGLARAGAALSQAGSARRWKDARDLLLQAGAALSAVATTITREKNAVKTAKDIIP